jgi:hypothetical protein
MNLLLAAVLVTLGLVLLLLALQFRKTSDLSRKETDLAPVLNNLGAIQKGQEQVDRSVRDEISRNRQEHSTQSQALRGEVVTALTGMGDSVSTKEGGFLGGRGGIGRRACLRCMYPKGYGGSSPLDRTIYSRIRLGREHADLSSRTTIEHSPRAPRDAMRCSSSIR